MTTAVTPIPTTSAGVNALLGDEAKGVARGGYVLADAPGPMPPLRMTHHGAGAGSRRWRSQSV